MFNNLTDRFKVAFKNLTGKGRLTEANIREAMAEIRTALLDADVNYNVVKKFVADVSEECLGEQVLNSITPGQQAIKVVSDKLTTLLGENSVGLTLTSKPSIIMLCGLHGSGKTTTSAKLALYLKDKLKRRPMLVGCDLYRPAAIDQIEILAKELDIPVFTERDTKNVTLVAQHAVSYANIHNIDTIILDTAGRLQIDNDLVQELVTIKNAVKPDEIILVGDAALGQEAVSVATHFDQALGITGIILTKLDGDARGGAALSMHQVTGKPIKFVTVGERAIDLEPFHPDRMASRILGMGDVISLVEKAQEQYEDEEAKKLEERLRKNTFGFDDFLTQIEKIRKMGGLMSLLKFIPGMGDLPMDGLDEKEFNRIEGIINSMTPKERRNPEIIGASRRQRIAKGAGVNQNELNQLLKQFNQMRGMMAKMGSGGFGFGDLMGGGGLGNMFGGGPAGMPQPHMNMPYQPRQSSSSTSRAANAAAKKKQKQARKQNRKKK
ncbi:MAG: signal recognition particle protein [Lentisphaerae bacterium]|jgi:signal recognition particle subunit SRP54|nr:signal recognition particle protein [Lentisphaerota bacterium]